MNVTCFRFIFVFASFSLHRFLRNNQRNKTSIASSYSLHSSFIELFLGALSFHFYFWFDRPVVRVTCDSTFNLFFFSVSFRWFNAKLFKVRPIKIQTLVRLQLHDNMTCIKRQQQMRRQWGSDERQAPHNCLFWNLLLTFSSIEKSIFLIIFIHARNYAIDKNWCIWRGQI